MRRVLARCLAVLPVAAVVLAACEQPVTTLKNAGTPMPAAVLPRASVANGLPLGLPGNIAVDSFTVCSIGADANYSWTSSGWPAFVGFNHQSYPSDPGSSGTAFVANGGATAPQAWNADKCQVAYAYPLDQHGGGVPVITATWQPQAGVRLDSIIKDSVKAQNLSTHTGPLETIFPAVTSSNSASGVVNNDYGSIAFFYYTLLPSLQLVKLADNTSVQAGQQIGFSMVVTNNGPGVANVVTLTDPLPTGSGLSWAVASPATGCSISAGTLTCSLGPLPAGQSATVHITSPTTAASCTSYSNTASATADGQPAVQSTAQTAVVCPPSISLAKKADAATVSAGSAIGFTLTVTSGGPGTAHSVSLSDPLPTGTGLSWSVSPAVSGCAISAGVLSCSFGDVAANASASVHVTSPTTAQSCATYPNTGTVTADGVGAIQASASTEVDCPSISVKKTADAASANAGSPIGFTITVTSGGPGMATAVTLTDVLPIGAGLSWSVNPAVSGCSIASGTLTCNLGDMAAGATASVHVTSPTTATSCGVYSNTASAASSNGAAGTSGPASEQVICPPSLTVSKTADAASVNAGSNIGFTVTVTSGGPGTATGVTLNDALPAGTGISWSVSPAVSGCGISSNTLSCSLGDLAAGTSVSVHVTSPTTAASCGKFDNTASAQSSNGASGTSGKVSETVVCAPPKLKLTKTADAASVKPGKPIGFTMTITNPGTSAAQNVTLSDPLPTGKGISWSISPANPACSISAGKLSCSFATLTAGASVSVHITSPTSSKTCGKFSNTATAAATGVTPLTASAYTTLTCGCYSVSYWSSHTGSSHGQNDDVTQYLPVWLGTSGGSKSYKVDNILKAIYVFAMSIITNNDVDKLYVQLLGAKLNVAFGADSSAVDSIVSAADAFLSTHDDRSSMTSAERTRLQGWTRTLNDYNDGIVGPGPAN